MRKPAAPRRVSGSVRLTKAKPAARHARATRKVTKRGCAIGRGIILGRRKRAITVMGVTPARTTSVVSPQANRTATPGRAATYTAAPPDGSAWPPLTFPSPQGLTGHR